MLLLALTPLSAQMEIGKIYTIPLGTYDTLAGSFNAYLTFQVTRTGQDTKNFHFAIDACSALLMTFNELNAGLELPDLDSCKLGSSPQPNSCLAPSSMHTSLSSRPAAQALHSPRAMDRFMNIRRRLDRMLSRRFLCRFPSPILISRTSTAQATVFYEWI